MALNTILSRVIGTTLQTSAQFKDFSNVVIIPDSVRLKIKRPDTTPVETVTVTSTTNTFAHSVLLDVAGVWNFRWECSGDYSSAEEFQINVEKSAL